MSIALKFFLISRTALSVEEVVRSNGVTPATIGVVDGKICIGNLVCCLILLIYCS